MEPVIIAIPYKIIDVEKDSEWLLLLVILSVSSPWRRCCTLRCFLEGSRGCCALRCFVCNPQRRVV
jgi:hypothetical protein